MERSLAKLYSRAIVDFCANINAIGISERCKACLAHQHLLDDQFCALFIHEDFCSLIFHLIF